MNANQHRTRRPSAAARAEAAAWIARLHGPNRTREVEDGLRRWLEADAEHTVAFEALTDIWEKTARLSRGRSAVVSTGPRLSFARALAAMLLAAFVPHALFHGAYTAVVTTGIGQFRDLTLADGTRVRVDAETRLRVRYTRRSRQVVLLGGEAYFAVRHRASWPFSVTAAGDVIHDLGTEFDVRREDGVLAVTLVKGQVTVSAADPGAEEPQSRAGAATGRLARRFEPSADVVPALTLSPGERVTFDGSRVARVDWPRLAQVMAWEHHEVVLDNTSLGQAARELNRYSPQRIVIDDPAVAAIRVSGIVQAGASSSFVAAVAQAYRLRASHPAPQVIVLARDR